MSVNTETETERVIELIARLRRNADAIVVADQSLPTRNAAVAMLDAANTLVDHVLDGLEPVLHGR